MRYEAGDVLTGTYRWMGYAPFLIWARFLFFFFNGWFLGGEGWRKV